MLIFKLNLERQNVSPKMQVLEHHTTVLQAVAVVSGYGRAKKKAYKRLLKNPLLKLLGLVSICSHQNPRQKEMG